jgi:predicted metal-binding membrane protein
VNVDRKDFTRIRIPVLIIAATAWIILVATSSTTMTQVHCLVMVSTTMSMQDSLQMLFTRNHPVTLAAGWFLMLVAMMAPVMVPPILHIYRRTFASRRPRSITFFLAGYIAVWMIGGALLVFLELILRLSAPESCFPAIAVLLLALIWQCSPFKQRCLNRCHNHRALAAFGSSADRDALRFGLEHGLWCTSSCWLWMLLPLLLPQAHLFAMFAVTCLIISERLENPSLPSWRPRGFGRAIRMSIAQARILLHRNAAQICPMKYS